MKARFLLFNVITLLLSAMIFVLPLASTPVSLASEVFSCQAKIGQAAPQFHLTDSTGKEHSLAEATGKFVVLEWVNFDCPFVRRHYDSGNMQNLQKTYTAKGVIWYSICSSAAGRQGNYPPQRINELIKQHQATPTAYLFDSDGQVGRLYGATATPNMFIINPKGVLIYRGAIDNNPTADIEETKNAVNYVQKALDEALAEKAVSIAVTKPYGCSVKYAN